MIARLAILLTALALVGVRLWYFTRLGDWLWLMLITATVQLAVVVAGLVARQKRPDSRVGLILLCWGFFVLLTGPGTAESGPLLVLESSLQPLYWTFLAHALLTYPDGLTHYRRERIFLTVAYLWPLCWFVPWLIAEPKWLVSCPAQGCPANPVLITPSASLLGMWWNVNNALAIGLGVWFLVLVILRRKGMAAPQRRGAAPALWAIGILTSTYLLKAGLPLLHVGNGTWWGVMWWTQRLATLLVPVGLLIALVSTKLARADVAALLIRLRTADIGELESSLAKLLRDPSLRVSRDPTDAVDLGDGYYLTCHRSARTEDPELFDAGVTAARLTIENSRLTRQVQAQRAEVSASRQRLVSAAEAERKRVERDLHDGAQQQLIGVGMALETARLQVPDGHPAAMTLEQASGQLRQSIDELRSLARGLRPAMLTERGLPTALAELRRRAKVPVTLDVHEFPRLGEAIETTVYFVVSESLQNAMRHAPGAQAMVHIGLSGSNLIVSVEDDGPGGAEVSGGTGLRGLADRVAAIGGELTVVSPAGGGTAVKARIPVAVEGK